MDSGFSGYFGLKQSPRNTASGPPRRADVPLLQVRLSEVASLQVSQRSLFSDPKSTFLTNLQIDYLETRQDN